MSHSRWTALIQLPHQQMYIVSTITNCKRFDLRKELLVSYMLWLIEVYLSIKNISCYQCTVGMIIKWKNTLFHCTIGSFCPIQGGCISHASTWATSSATRLSWWPWGIRIAWHTDQLVTFLMNQKLAYVATESLATQSPYSVMAICTIGSLKNKQKVF